MAKKSAKKAAVKPAAKAPTKKAASKKAAPAKGTRGRKKAASNTAKTADTFPKLHQGPPGMR